MSATYRRQIERLFAHSAFYREKLRAAGFDSPAAVGGIENIAALPFTEKDELRKSQAEDPPLGAHAAIDISQAARIYSTSGDRKSTRLHSSHSQIPNAVLCLPTTLQM